MRPHSCVFALTPLLGALSLGAQQPPSAKQVPPAPGTPKAFRVPPRQTFTLPNGMRVTLVAWGRVPKAVVDIQLLTGSIDEANTDVSLSAVATNLLLEGTTTKTAQDISRAAAEMGGSVFANPGNSATTLGGEVLSEHAPAFVALLADVLQNPRFDAGDVKRVVDNQIRDNAIALARPGTLAQKRFREMMYGDHPYGRSFPTDSALKTFSADRVRAFHTAHFGAARSHLYVSGVFDPKSVETAIRKAFAGWRAGSAPTDNPPKVAARRQLDVIDRAGSVQSAIVMGVPVARPGDADWIALNVTDALLGGAFGSRITTNIREDKGYTYSPFSTLITRRGATIWAEIADVTTNVTGPSLTEIFKEMDRLRTEAPPMQELEGIKQSMAGTFTIQNSSRSGLVNQLEFVDLHGLGDDYLASYVPRVMAVKPDDVRATAQKHLDPAKVSIAVVGDKKQIEKQLGQFKPIVP